MRLQHLFPGVWSVFSVSRTSLFYRLYSSTRIGWSILTSADYRIFAVRTAISGFIRATKILPYMGRMLWRTTSLGSAASIAFAARAACRFSTKCKIPRLTWCQSIYGLWMTSMCRSWTSKKTICLNLCTSIAERDLRLIWELEIEWIFGRVNSRFFVFHLFSYSRSVSWRKKPNIFDYEVESFSATCVGELKNRRYTSECQNKLFWLVFEMHENMNFWLPQPQRNFSCTPFSSKNFLVAPAHLNLQPEVFTSLLAVDKLQSEKFIRLRRP